MGRVGIADAQMDDEIIRVCRKCITEMAHVLGIQHVQPNNLTPIQWCSTLFEISVLGQLKITGWTRSILKIITNI